MTRFAISALAVMAIALAAPAGALAAPPTVTTGGASDVTQTSATLRGSVNPRGNPTFYFFQYGESKLYGAQTPQTDAGSGQKRVPSAAPVAGLAPFTTYHYRIVAQFGQRVVFGTDKTFRTDRQPLGITLTADPTTVFPNGDATIAGNVSGTNNGQRQVVLQQNPHPFTGFTDFGNTVLTDDAGNFAFNLRDVPVNTVYRVRLPSKPELVSPEVAINVRVILSLKSVSKKIRRGEKARFSGSVAPANPGAEVLIERRFSGQWVTVKRTTLGRSSKFQTGIRPRRSGKFRVSVTPGTAYVGDVSSVKTIKVQRKRRR